MDCKGAQETFGDDGNGLYLGCGGVIKRYTIIR